MKYWWVNQGGSFELEHAGNFMWSPQKERNGRRNQAYENMKEVSPGDLIFSHYDAHVSSIGTAQSYCYEAQRPSDFPKDQNAGNDLGWRIDVTYSNEVKKFHPQSNYENIKGFLPEKYAPLDKRGQAAQKLYLVSVTKEFANKLMSYLEIDSENFPPVDKEKNKEEISNESFEEEIINKIMGDQNLSAGEKVILSKARIGQGIFRDRVRDIEKKCRVSEIDNPEFLIASHIKPWKVSDNFERIDGNNGLFLSPNIDKLFDKYFISFSDDGRLLISPLISEELRQKFGLRENMFVGPFNNDQKKYLSHHRERLKYSSKVE